MPANEHIFAVSLFSVFQEIYSGCCTVAAQMLRLLHQHNVRDDRYLTRCLEAAYASLVLSVFWALRHDEVLHSSPRNCLINRIGRMMTYAPEHEKELLN